MPNGTPTNLWIDERGHITEVIEGERPEPTLVDTGILEVQRQADAMQRQEYEDRMRRMEQEMIRHAGMTGRTTAPPPTVYDTIDPGRRELRYTTTTPRERPTPPWATPNADFWMFDELAKKPVEAMEITLIYKGKAHYLNITELAIKDITTTESQEYIAMKVVEAIKEQWGGKLDEKK